MRPRIEEILEDVRAQLEIAGFYELKSQKFVLTGGTSLPGLDTLTSRILGQQVRIGRPLRSIVYLKLILDQAVRPWLG